jgi:hypothetical protein
MAWQETPEFADVLEYYTGWNKNGYFSLPDDIPHDDSRKYNLGYVANGDLAFTNLASCVVSSKSIWYQIIEEKVNSINIRGGNQVKAFRLYPDKKVQRVCPLGDGNLTTNDFYYAGGCIAFSSSSRNIKDALRLLEWIYSSQENYDLFMYGIEGENYIPVGTDYIKLRDYYCFQIYNALTPGHPNSLPFPEDLPDSNYQFTCEFGGLFKTLLLMPDTLWSYFTQEQKNRMVVMISKWAHHRTTQNNWRIFNIVTLSFLKRHGYEIEWNNKTPVKKSC